MKKLPVRIQRTVMLMMMRLTWLQDIIPSNQNGPFMKQFLDLLKKIFVYDPEKRITAKDALQHPWFREAPHPDDGTEAAKLRKERIQREQAAARIPHAMHSR